MTGGAGNGFVFVQCLLRLPDHGELFLRHGAEVLHGAEVVLHLRKTAHPRQYRDDVADACREPDRPAGIGEAAARFVEYGFHRVDRIRQNAPFDRFHHRDGDPAFLADFPIPPRRHTGILPVGVIQLELNELRVRMRVEKRFEQVGIRVEGEAPVPDLPRLFQLLHIVPDMILVVLAEGAALDRVEQVEVEVSCARPLKADVKLTPRARFIGTARGGRVQLGRKGIALPRDPFGQGLAHGQLRASAVVHIGGVEIGASRGQKSVGHLNGLFDIDAPVRILRKTHQSESELEELFSQIV